MTPIEENESWIRSVPPGVTRAPQSRMSARAGAYRWAPSMYSTSIPPSSLGVCMPSENSRMWVTRSRTPAVTRLASNRGVVVGCSLLEAVELLRAAIVSGVRVDRHDFDARRGGECEQRSWNGPESSRSRRSGRPPDSSRRRRAGLGSLAFGHPSLDVGDGQPGLIERGATGHVYTCDAEHDHPHQPEHPAARGPCRRPPRAPNRGPCRASGRSAGTLPASARSRARSTAARSRPALWSRTPTRSSSPARRRR